MKPLHIICVLALLLLSPLSFALIETYEFSDPALERRYQALSEELRCPKCQNQNIASSDAPIAQDLRKILHQQLEEGSTDEQIRDYMVARYGEFVRYRPSFDGPSRYLWLAPFFLLGVGLVVLFFTIRSRRQVAAVADATLTADDRARLDALLSPGSRDS